MATAKQKAAARRNIKKAQKARWGVKPYTYKLPRPKHKGRIQTPADRVACPLNNVKTLI